MNIDGPIPSSRRPRIGCGARIMVLVWGFLASVALLPAEDGEKNHRDETLPLPPWPANGEEVLRADRSLWPADFNPNEVVHPAHPVSPGEKGGEDEIWSRFLPRGLFSGGGKKSSTAEKPLEEMSDDAWHACEEMPAETRLFDPQGLLSETQAEDMRRLLSFHTERAGVTAAIVLLDARQKLPPQADLTRLAGGALTPTAACIVVYPLGEPDRTRVFFTKIVTQTAEPAYLGNLASTCIREAVEHPDPGEQLQRFVIQLSIRLFWLERAYPTLQPAPAIPVASSAPHPLAAQEPQPLSEVTPPPSALSLYPRIEALVSQNKAGLLVAGAALGFALLLITAIISFLRWRRRRLRHCVWILPEPTTAPVSRLGGPHCGASGAFIQYG